MFKSSTSKVAVLIVVVVPLTVKFPVTVKSFAAVTSAPLNVNAVVVPDLIIKSPEEFTKLHK